MAYFLAGGRGRDFSEGLREAAYFSFAAKRDSMFALGTGY
jgi:hypothetical protein